MRHPGSLVEAYAGTVRASPIVVAWPWLVYLFLILCSEPHFSTNFYSSLFLFVRYFIVSGTWKPKGFIDELVFLGKGYRRLAAASGLDVI